MSDYLYGLHAVQSALERAPDSVSELWVDAKRSAKQNDKRMALVLQLAETAGCTVHSVDKRKLDGMAPEARHQGVVAEAAAPKIYSESELGTLLGAVAGFRRSCCAAT